MPFEVHCYAEVPERSPSCLAVTNVLRKDESALTNPMRVYAPPVRNRSNPDHVCSCRLRRGQESEATMMVQSAREISDVRKPGNAPFRLEARLSLSENGA